MWIADYDAALGRTHILDFRPFAITTVTTFSTLYAMTTDATSARQHTLDRVPRERGLFNIFQGIDADPFGGGFYLTLRNIRMVGDSVVRFDPTRGSLSTIAQFPFLAQPGRLVTWGSRLLGGLNRPTIGSRYDLLLRIPTESGQAYAAAAAFGTSPGLPVAPGRRIALIPDALFAFSIGATTMFRRFSGTLSATGLAQPAIQIPNRPTLRGLRFFVAALTHDHRGVRVITEPLPVTIE